MNCPKCGNELTVMNDIVTCYTSNCIGTRTVKSLSAEKRYEPEVRAARLKKESGQQAPGN